MSDYIERLQGAIKNMHGVESKHLDSVSVLETFQGKVIWEGEVEIFSLESHPQAKTCFAWAHKEPEKGDHERYYAVLCVPPINTPQKAVQAAIASQGIK